MDAFTAQLATHFMKLSMENQIIEEKKIVQFSKNFGEIQVLNVFPWDDENTWNLLLEAATQGPEAFMSGLEYFVFGSYREGCKPGMFRFVFHKSMTKEQRHSIHKISGKNTFKTFTQKSNGDSVLNVFCHCE